MKVILPGNMGPPDVFGQMLQSKLARMGFMVFIIAFPRVNGITNLPSMYNNPSDSSKFLVKCLK